MLAPGLEVLVAAQLLAGGAWGCVLVASFTGAIQIGRTGREGLALGTFFAILAAGFFVGIVVGLTGMGGGALMTPALIFLGVGETSTVITADLTAAAAYKALPAGVHEGLLASDRGEILEGLSSNFFGVAGSTLRTEGDRILEGVTRSLVLELARGLAPVVFSPVLVSEIGSLGEAFVTSASRGVLPVVRVDDVQVGSGRPGPLTRNLIQRFAELVENEAEDLFR